MSDAREWEAVQPGMSPELSATSSLASPPVAGPLWRVPYERNDHFAGRDQLLETLEKQLNKQTHATRTIAMVGPAGIGKTQVALEYAHRHRDEYPLVCWLRAKSTEQLEHDLHALARDLGLGAEANLPSARPAVRKALAARSKWLLVFDGAPDPETIAGCLPPRHKGHVLVTTRNAQWKGVGTAGMVPAFERAESMAFLRARTGRGNESILSSGQLAKALGDFPLALEMAAVVINQKQWSFDGYLRDFEAVWAEMLQQGRGTVRDGLALAMEMSCRALASVAPSGAELLKLLAFFAAEGFQRAWLTAGERVLVEPLATTVREFGFLQEALRGLADFSMIDLAGAQMTIDETVASFIRGRLNHQEFAEHAHLALRLMDSAFRFDGNDPRTWSEGMAMLPHALSAVEHAQHTDVTVAASASLLNQVGQCLFRHGRYDQARAILDKALELAYRIYGEQNSRLSAIANNLGRVLMRLSELDEARRQFEWSLSLDEQTYGNDHPHVAEILNNLGTCLLRLGRHEEARPMFERALAIYGMQCSPSHPNAASIVNNIGYTRMIAGDLAGSWELLQRALGVVHASYGPNHPDVACILLNMGDVLRLQGSQAVARAQYQRAMLIDEICFGPAHPDVARDAAHLGAVLMEMGDPAAARAYFERAVAIDEAVFGPRHVNMIERLQDLGRCLKQLDAVDESADCFGRANELARLLPAAQAAAELEASSDEAA